MSTVLRPLVGRRAELARLHEAYAHAATGEPQTVIVGGEAGVGKTRLVQQLGEYVAEQDARLLYGACVPLGAEGLPLVPVTDVLRELVHDPGPTRLLDLVPGASTLAHLVPELGAPSNHSEPTDELPGQGRVVHLFTSLLERLSADQPLVLVIEDLHWADRSTRQLLSALPRGLRRGRVLVVATYRSDDLHPGHPLRAILGELDRVDTVGRIELDRLSRDETAELIAAETGHSPPPSLAQRIFERSEGNAFFVQELVRAENAGRSPGLDESLRDLVLQQVERLSPPVQDVVRIAALGGRMVPHRLLAAVVGSALDMTDDALVENLRPAVDGHVLVIDGDAYCFRHALVWEAVALGSLPGERLRLHRAYAEALERDPSLLPGDRIAAETAHHWWEAADTARSIPALVRAAETAESMQAYCEQLDMLGRALRVLPSAPDSGLVELDLLERAIDAAWRTGDQERALELVDQALAESSAEDQPERRAVLLARRSRLLLNLDREGALETVEEARRLVPDGRSAARATVLGVLSQALVQRGHTAAARDTSAAAVDIARELGDPELEASAWTTLAMSWAQSGETERALAELDGARKLAERRHDVHALTRIHLVAAFVLWGVGRHGPAIAAAADGVAAAGEAGLSRSLGSHAACLRALSLLALGRWDEADAQAVEALEFDPPPLFAALPWLIRGDIAMLRADVASARDHLASARAALDPRYVVQRGGLVLARLAAEIALAAGEIDEARTAVTQGLDVPHGSGDITNVWALLITGAQVETDPHARLDETASDRAIDRLRRAAATLPTYAPPWRAYAAQFDAELGAFHEPGPSWDDVATAWDHAGQPYPACYARFRAAAAALAANRPAQARDWLVAAHQEALRLGAIALQQEIGVLARRAHIALPAEESAGAEHDDQLGRFGLTPREIEVLRLLTDGASNREIATELFISAKTASVHVSRILGKLDVRTRGEAAALAHRLQVFDT